MSRHNFQSNVSVHFGQTASVVYTNNTACCVYYMCCKLSSRTRFSSLNNFKPNHNCWHYYNKKRLIYQSKLVYLGDQGKKHLVQLFKIVLKVSRFFLFSLVEIHRPHQSLLSCSFTTAFLRIGCSNHSNVSFISFLGRF